MTPAKFQDKTFRDKVIEYAELLKEVMQVDPYTAVQAAFYGSDITADEYFEHLYIDRKIRKQIQQQVIDQHSHDLICLVGPRGSGKSSIGRKIERELKKKDESAFFNFFDVRHRNVRQYLENDGIAVAFFRSKMKNSYLDAFLKSKKQTELLAFLLNGNMQKENRPPSIFEVFAAQTFLTAISVQAAKAALKQKIADGINLLDHEIKALSAKLETYDVVAWCKDLEKDNANMYCQLVQEVIIEMADVPHLAYAYRYLFGGTKTQIFWFDNIDNLSGEDQVTLINALHTLQQEVHEIIRIVIAAREENIYREKHYFDAGAPTLRSPIYVDDPHNFNLKVPGVNIRRVIDKEIDEIIEKRLAFFRMYFNKKKPDEPFQEDVYALVERVMRDVVKDTFATEKMIYVANNSLRELLPMYADFLIFLLQKYDAYQEKQPIFKEFPPALNDPPYFRITELLCWLAHERTYFVFSNIAEFCDCPQQLSTQEHTCFLPHVLLTCIWNLSREKRDLAHPAATFVSPTIKDVLTKLSQLGFTETECKNALYKLYRPQQGRSHFIVIETREILFTEEQISNDFRVRITSRGKVALSRVFNSFGYFYGSIKRYKESSPYTLPSNRVGDGTLVLKYLKNMYGLHLSALKRIRDSFTKPKSIAPEFHKRKNNHWFDQYLLQFGIPIDEVLTRKKEPNSAVTIGGTRFILYFPYLLECLIPYFEGTTKITTKLEKLLRNFNNYVNQLAAGKEISEFELPDDIAQ